MTVEQINLLRFVKLALEEARLFVRFPSTREVLNVDDRLLHMIEEAGNVVNEVITSSTKEIV